MEPLRLPVQSRSRSVALLVGVVIGLLVAGLAIPFVFGERLTSSSASLGGDNEPGGVDDELLPVPGSPSGSPLAPGTSGSPAPGTTPAVGPGAVAPSSGPGVPGPQLTSGPRAPLTSTDRGVTSRSVKVGFTVLDTAGASRVGVGVGVTVEQQTAAWHAYVKDINARGGLHGRMIEPVVVTYDPLSEDSQRTACQKLTEDAKVFAVVGGFNYPSAVSCITRENKTPLFSGYPSTMDEIYATSGGRFVTLYPKASRMMASIVAALDQAGRLKGRTIGILSQMQNDPGGKTSAALEAAIEHRGYTVKRRADLDADTGTSAAQVPVTVNQFKDDGINTVIVLAGLLTATQFVQQAESQGYRPAYHLTDWANNNNDVAVQNMPQSLDGTLGVTFIWGNGNKQPYGKETAEMARCRSLHDKYSGRRLAARGTAEYGATTQACDSILVFERAAKATGPQLTRDRIAAVVPTLGAFPVANFGAGSFRGRSDFSEQLRYHQFRSSCSCWVPSGGFFTPR